MFSIVDMLKLRKYISVIDEIYFEINTFEILLAINSTKSELPYWDRNVRITLSENI